ncbi:MAG: hypothetical protein N0A16_11440 [Blastocatellia bacterium]|nr:hypothetical protein [Blastocatellia bacterium]MCS7158329.1 hypothetical protein [Blastocatellia bacterium]MCX7752835.1 hypothetical protein [Blastocatellia bacterium]MDW8167891.1 hypothetical protein [Acidobacteriota bacterium]MDW8257250.1 hypothetical protein [Acidobacteriota bacterium]
MAGGHAAAQGSVSCSVVPNSGMQATTLSATITLGPHIALSQLMATMTPQQMLAATSMTLSPGGVEIALLQTTFLPLTQQVTYTGTITIFQDASPGARNLRISIRPREGLPVELTCPLAFTVETPAERLQRANETFRSEVASALQAIGRQAGALVQTDNFAFAFNGNPPLVVNAMIRDAGDLPLERLSQGVDILLVFLWLPVGSALPSGFYVIRVFRDPPAGSWWAQFKDLGGRILLQTPMEVSVRPTEDEAQKPRYQLTAKGKLIPPTLIIDWHKKDRTVQVDAQIELPIGTGGADAMPLPSAGQAIVRAANTLLSAARDAIAAGATLIRADAAWTVAVASDQDGIVAWTYINGMERASIEDLARGRETILTFGLGKFWLYRIRRDENGQWLATSRSPDGESYTQVAEVSLSGGPPASPLPTLLTSIEPDDVSPTLVTPVGITIKQKDCGGCGCRCGQK